MEIMADTEALKLKFSTGKKPTGEDFSELIDGVKGDQGAKGDTGAAGPAGKDGAKGDAGAKGATGAAGKDGEKQFTDEEVIALKALVVE